MDWGKKQQARDWIDARGTWRWKNEGQLKLFRRSLHEIQGHDCAGSPANNSLGFFLHILALPVEEEEEEEEQRELFLPHSDLGLSFHWLIPSWGAGSAG